MAASVDITPQLLRQLLRYEAETGKLFWLERPIEMFAHCKFPHQIHAAFNARDAGNEALTVPVNGYLSGRILGRGFLAHRVAYAIYHGQWPAHQIDHINGDRADNRIENLRTVPAAENMRNLKRPITNTSGHIGVRPHRKTGRFRAEIKVAGRSIALGVYRTEADAIAARKEAERRYNFHPNHGRA